LDFQIRDPQPVLNLYLFFIDSAKLFQGGCMSTLSL
jgi:hypothetical protein